MSSIWADDSQSIHSVMFHFLSIFPNLVSVRWNCPHPLPMIASEVRATWLGQQWRFLFWSRLLVVLGSQKAWPSRAPRVFAIRIYLGWSRLHLWPRLHARGEGRRADLVVEIFSADSSACITHPPKDSTALLEWVSWLVHNAYLMDISTLKSANVHAVMWEELNTDTMDTTIHHFYLMS